MWEIIVVSWLMFILVIVMGIEFVIWIIKGDFKYNKGFIYYGFVGVGFF